VDGSAPPGPLDPDARAAAGRSESVRRVSVHAAGPEPGDA
jgi:hypothetical protein